MQTKEIFCARCQQVTTHTAMVDANGEFLFTCQNQVPVVTVEEGAEETTELCGRFMKLPSDIDLPKFNELIAKHEESNVGQVSLADQEKKLTLFLEAEPEVKKEEAVVEETPAEEVAEPVVEEAAVEDEQVEA